MIENFNPNPIEDEGLRQVFIALMNLVETLSAKVQEQAEEIQRLRDENNRLKGEQGKPKFKANAPALTVSSEKERSSRPNPITKPRSKPL
jgi:valyl-tRNA synthetase